MKTVIQFFLMPFQKLQILLVWKKTQPNCVGLGLLCPLEKEEKLVSLSFYQRKTGIIVLKSVECYGYKTYQRSGHIYLCNMLSLVVKSCFTSQTEIKMWGRKATFVSKAISSQQKRMHVCFLVSYRRITNVPSCNSSGDTAQIVFTII